jgi:hypothetical protein
LFIALLTQWPRFHAVISLCFVHSRVRDKLVVGLKQPRSQGLWDSRWQRQTYSCKKHGDITFMCACDGKTWPNESIGGKSEINSNKSLSHRSIFNALCVSEYCMLALLGKCQVYEGLQWYRKSSFSPLYAVSRYQNIHYPAKSIVDLA